MIRPGIVLKLWAPRNIDPRKPLTGLALKLLAIGAFGTASKLDISDVVA
jgi:hypothetical protein